MSEKSEKKPLQRILIVALGSSFLGFLALPFASIFRSSSQQSDEIANPETTSIEQQLQAQERGYELVLEREPENPVALQGLVETRLQMNDLEGVMEPMEKLVELYPEQVELKAFLAAVKQQVGEQSEETKIDKDSDH